MIKKEIKISERVKCIFLVIGIVFCSLCIFRPVVQSIRGENETIETSAAKKDLPIYCVDTKEKKVAISFDAAWGADRLRSNYVRSGKGMNTAVCSGSHL